VVTAFKKAFPKKDHSVGLVLKVMNAQEKDARWESFKATCKTDGRIQILTGTMDRHEILGLIRCCDAYVSLHRSEGFGRTLAEAMLFGKPVIATHYSGNTDFMNPDLSFPVDYKLIPVTTGDYGFVETNDGAQWAEVKIADAVRQMKAAVIEAQKAGFSQKITAFANKQFSVKRIGKLVSERLKQIAKQRGLPSK
jgi:glycosyltransferase involved in cell wall biosynthesis